MLLNNMEDQELVSKNSENSKLQKGGWGSGNARTNLEIVRPKFGDLAGVELSPMNS